MKSILISRWLSRTKESKPTTFKLTILFLNFLALSLLFLIVEPRPSRAEYLFSDSFENDLSQWQIEQEGEARIELVKEPVLFGNQSLKITFYSGYLRLKKTLPQPYQEVVLRAYFYENMGAQKNFFLWTKDESGHISALGSLTSIDSNYYLVRVDSQWIPTAIKRSKGWHLLEIVFLNNQTYFKIDGELLTNPRTENKPSGNTVTFFRQTENSLEYKGSKIKAITNPNQQGLKEFSIFSSWDVNNQYLVDEVSLIKPEENLKLLLFEPCRAYLEKYQKINWKDQVFPFLSTHNTAPSVLRHIKLLFFDWLINKNESSLNQGKELLANFMEEVDWSLLDEWRTRPITLLELMFVNWLYSDHLSEDEKTKIESMIVEQGTLYTNLQPRSSYQNDTAAEDNAWKSSVLSALGNHFLFPFQKRQILDNKAKCFAFHTFTISPQAAEERGDSSTACGFTSQTLWDDYSLENHNFIHPMYMASSQYSLGVNALFYRLAGRKIPSEVTHNIENLWDGFGNWMGYKNTVDWKNFAYNINYERYQGGFLLVGPFLYDFLTKEIGPDFFLKRGLNFDFNTLAKARYLLSYSTPSYFSAKPILPQDFDETTWVFDITIPNTYFNTYLSQFYQELPSIRWGDYNNDWQRTGGDFKILLSRYHQEFPKGDFNQDNKTNSIDFSSWVLLDSSGN